MSEIIFTFALPLMFWWGFRVGHSAGFDDKLVREQRERERQEKRP